MKVNSDRRREILYYSVFVTIILVVIYMPMVIRERMYIFIDIAADTYGSYWPSLAYIKEWIKEPTVWDTNLGLGQAAISRISSFLVDPFNIFTYFFSNYDMYIGIFIALILKNIVLAIGSFLYVRKIAISDDWRINNIVSISIVFSGWFMGWGQHYPFGTMYVGFVFLLYFFEILLQNGRWIGVIGSIAFLCLLTPYFSYMILIFLAVYYVARYMMICEKFVFLNWARTSFKVLGICILGIGTGFVLFLPYVEEILGSPRVGGGASLSLRFSSIVEYSSFLLRLFSNNVLGINNTVAYNNYYGAPFMYMGILTLLIIPTLLISQNKEKKYILVGICCVISVLFSQNTALVFNFFSAIVYRWTFIYVPVLACGLGRALDKILKNGISKRMICCTSLIGILLNFAVLIYYYSNKIDMPKETVYSIIFNIIVIVCYLVILLDIQKNKISLLMILFLVEISFNGYVGVNWRSLIPKENRQSMNYFDASNELIEYLDETDQSFYRISKNYAQNDLSDSLMQHYNGEKLYSPTLQKSYWDLQELFKLRTKGSNYFKGFDDKQALRDISCGKYMITSEPNEYFGYELVNSIKGRYLYRNTNAMEFGFLYNQIMDINEYNGLSEKLQRDVVYNTAILENTESLEAKCFEIVSYVENADFMPITHSMNVTADCIEVFIEENNENPILIEINVGGEITETISGNIYMAVKGADYSNVDTIPISITSKDKHFYLINTLDIEKIKIGINPNCISQINVYEKDMAKIEEIIDKNKENSLDVSEWSDQYVEGNIKVEQEEALLFLPIIHNKNWHIYVNGIEQELYKVNGGFSGVVVYQGENHIILRYEPSAYFYGMIVSVISLMATIIIWKKNRRIVIE